MMEQAMDATRGNWNDVWDSFDRCKKLRANDGSGYHDPDGGGEDLFKPADIAAE